MPAPQPMIYTDSSGNGRHGFGLDNTRTGIPVPGLVSGDNALDATYRNLFFQTGIVFNAPTTAVSRSHTFEFWIQGNASLAVWITDPSSQPPAYTILRGQPSNRGIRWNIPNSNMISSSGLLDNVINDSNPHYLAFVVEAPAGTTVAAAKYYVDGSLFHTTAYTQSGGIQIGLPNGPPVCVGGTNAGSFGISWGVYDELAFYPVALSAGQVAAHYAARGSIASYSAAVLADSPQVYYHLGDSQSFGWSVTPFGYYVTD